MTLTYLPSKCRNHIYWAQIIILWSLYNVCQMKHKLLRRKSFQIEGHCDLVLWPTDPYDNKGLWFTILWSLNSLGRMVFKLSIRKVYKFKVTVILTLGLLTPKTIGVFNWAWPMSLSYALAFFSYLSDRLSVLILRSSGQRSCSQWLTNEQMTSISNMIEIFLTMYMKVEAKIPEFW